MLKDKILSRQGIIISVLVFAVLLIIGLLLGFKVLTLNSLWALIFVLPVMVFIDLCYVLLPVTVPALLILSGYTIVTKSYQKYVYAYEMLTISILCGIINYTIDNLLDNLSYMVMTEGYRIYWFIFFLAVFIISIINLAKLKDNRVYLWVFVPMIVFYMLFQMIIAAE